MQTTVDARHEMLAREYIADLFWVGRGCHGSGSMFALMATGPKWPGYML
jgi:hypothetical protein